MGNARDRSIPPARKRVVEIGKNTEKLRHMSEIIDSTFKVFNVLKCPDCDCDIDSHVDMKEKCGYSNYIVLQCKNIVRLEIFF